MGRGYILRRRRVVAQLSRLYGGIMEAPAAQVVQRLGPLPQLGLSLIHI